MMWGIIPILDESDAASYEIMHHQNGGGNERGPFKLTNSLKDKIITVPEGHAFTAVGELWKMRQCLEFGVELFGSLVLQGKPGGLLCAGNIGKASLLRRTQVIGEAAKYFATGGKKILLISELSKVGYAHHKATTSLARVQIMWVQNYAVNRSDALFHRPASLSIDAGTFKQEIGDSKFLHMTTGRSSAEYGHKHNKSSARV